MSATDNTAIDELNRLNDKFFEEMRESDSFKFGYCRSAINTALWYYDLGHTEQAVAVLRDCAELMRGKTTAEVEK